MTLRWAPMSSAGISGRGFHRGQHDLGLDPPLELFVQAFNCIRCPDRFPLAFWEPHLVRQASPGQRKWPKISIWHGSHDEVVAPDNASALVRQWIDNHQVDEAGATQDEVDGQPRMSWRDSSGAVVVEHYFGLDGETGPQLKTYLVPNQNCRIVGATVLS
jgi:hypothetical protein